MLAFLEAFLLVADSNIFDTHRITQQESTFSSSSGKNGRANSLGFVTKNESLYKKKLKHCLEHVVCCY